jgi:hypothetical protein
MKMAKQIVKQSKPVEALTVQLQLALKVYTKAARSKRIKQGLQKKKARYAD